jgi:hypothetical protein
METTTKSVEDLAMNLMLSFLGLLQLLYQQAILDTAHPTLLQLCQQQSNTLVWSKLILQKRI